MDPADEGDAEMSEQVIERVEAEPAERRHVKLWFGSHVIGEYVGDIEAATRYAEAMDKRFAGLHITNEPVPPGEDPVRALPLPSRRLWGNTPN